MLNEYDFMSFYIIYSLISWSIDFLSDSAITCNESKLGLFQYFHHLVSISHIGIVFLLFFSKNINMTIYSIIISIIAQIGWLHNNDQCWYSTMINKIIDPMRPKRKWRGEWGSFIKHYIRGNIWAESDIYNVNMELSANITNIAAIFQLIKIINFN